MQKPIKNTKRKSRTPIFENWFYLEQLQCFYHNQKGEIPLKSFLSGKLCPKIYEELQRDGFYINNFLV